jgi:transposase
MSSILQFDPKTRQLTGPAGTLSVLSTDPSLQRFLMLLEGECLEENVTSIATKYGYSRQRYYQLLADYNKGGLLSLVPEKTGPKSNHRRTDVVVRQVLRYRFLDPDISAEVITQKLRQAHFIISLRSVHRILADYGVQKKTPDPQPQKSSTPNPHPTRQKKGPTQARRRSQRGKGGSPTSGG